MTLPSPNPVFRFQGETYSVKIENVAHTGMQFICARLCLADDVR